MGNERNFNFWAGVVTNSEDIDHTTGRVKSGSMLPLTFQECCDIVAKNREINRNRGGQSIPSIQVDKVMY